MGPLPFLRNNPFTPSLTYAYLPIGILPMMYTIRSDAARGRGIVVFGRIVRGPDLVKTLQALPYEAQMTSCTAHVYDFRAVELLDVAADWLPVLIVAVRKTMYRAQPPLGLLVAGRTTHTFAHMLAALIRRYTGRSVEVFLQEAQMEAWLAAYAQPS